MKLRLLLFALLSGALPLSASHAAVDLSITVAPPVLRVYEQPVCPVEGYLWTPGYWAYDAGYYWVDGVWVPPPRVGYLWTPPYWGFANGFYAFHEGYWGPTVGFYGGINYGFGYGGYGYDGGRWDGRVFRYNTAVTRVNVRNIHNTYVDRTVVRENNNRTSFNGRGGINARPDARQLAAANGPHTRATSQQRSARQTAGRGEHVGTPQAASNQPNGRRNAGRGGDRQGQGNFQPVRQGRAVTNAPQRGSRRGRTMRQSQEQRQRVFSPQPGRGPGGGGGHFQGRGHGGGGHPQQQGHGEGKKRDKH